jgi:cyclophilin family peptidyl-prolyl cis-trans isomerase
MQYKILLIYFTFALLLGCQEPKTAAFSIELLQEETPAQVQFKNESVGATSYLWDFGDGNTSTEAAPRYTYNFGGTYNVTLTVFDADSNAVTTVKPVTVRESVRRVVEIETEFGTMKAELFNFTPKHRDNFLKLATEGFYDDLLFHRVMNDFMVQGGDPTSRNAAAGTLLGQGNTDYTVPAEIVQGAYHYKGALAAARQSDGANPERASSGSQFYIVDGSPHQAMQLQQFVNQKSMRGVRVVYSQPQVDYYAQYGGSPILDMEYTVFGQITEGLHIIDKLAEVPVDFNNRPFKDVKMKVRVVK